MIEDARQPKAKFEPAAELVIDDLDTLKVLADPLRLRILELFHTSRTVKQVAADLDMPATKLYYHVNQLEQRGLIRMVDTRIVSGIIEKHYQIAARRFHIKRDLLSPGTTESEGSLELTLLDGAKAEIIESVQAGVIDLAGEQPSMGMEISQATFRLPRERAEEFRQRLQALVKEFGDEDDEAENLPTQVYKFLYAWYPTARRLPEDETD